MRSILPADLGGASFYDLTVARKLRTGNALFVLNQHVLGRSSGPSGILTNSTSTSLRTLLGKAGNAVRDLREGEAALTKI
jgi:hypothetical protein